MGSRPGSLRDSPQDSLLQIPLGNRLDSLAHNRLASLPCNHLDSRHPDLPYSLRRTLRSSLHHNRQYSPLSSR